MKALVFLIIFSGLCEDSFNLDFWNHDYITKVDKETKSKLDRMTFLNNFEFTEKEYLELWSMNEKEAFLVSRLSTNWKEAKEIYNQMPLDERKRHLQSNFTVTVVVPHYDLGGYGDLMSNVWMARLLKLKGFETDVVVPPQYFEKMKVLFPNFDERKSEQFLFDLKVKLVFENKINSVPFVFSALKKSKVATDEVISSDIAPIYFKEYSGKQKFEVENDLHATGANCPGLYLLNREFVFPIVLEEKFRLQNGVSAQEDITLLYTAGNTASVYFYSAVGNLSNRQDKKIHVFGNVEMGAHPENVIFHKYNSMAFEDMELLTYLSNLPLLVTGDMSATLAMQYEKPFFYECFPHKKEFFIKLKSELEREGLTKANWRNVCYLCNEEKSWFSAYSNRFEWLFESDHYQNFKMALKKLKAREQLPERIISDFCEF